MIISKKGKGLINSQPPVFFNDNEIKKELKKIIAFYITEAALNHGLFQIPKELALISGAGIAGLAASFELLARGFKVIITEKRTTFDRFNIINLDVETQRFLKKFGLLEEFEKSVGARIKQHKYVLFEENGMRHLGSSDVSQLQPSNLSFEPEFFNRLFNEDGVYSVRIKDLQTFLAKKALEAGVHIFGNVETAILARTQIGGVSKVQITGKDGLYDPITLQPNLFFVAEGAHSPTAKQLGLKISEVQNECTGESWIFGNVQYFGAETFVVSMIDISGESLEIANIIFNAKLGVTNIAVTSKKSLNQELIQERILNIVQRIFSLQNISNLPHSLSAVVKHPVYVNNEQRPVYSKGNIFCIGDAAGHSSPLAGMGGTLGLTLVPSTVKQLVNDYEIKSDKMHLNFYKFTEGYTSRWITKSQVVKKHCQSFFNNKERTTSVVAQNSHKENEPAPTIMAPK